MIKAVIIWGIAAILLVSVGVLCFNHYFLTRKRWVLLVGWLVSALSFIPTFVFLLYFIIQKLP